MTVPQKCLTGEREGTMESRGTGLQHKEQEMRIFLMRTLIPSFTKGEGGGGEGGGGGWGALADIT